MPNVFLYVVVHSSSNYELVILLVFPHIGDYNHLMRIIFWGKFSRRLVANTESFCLIWLEKISLMQNSPLCVYKLLYTSRTCVYVNVKRWNEGKGENQNWVINISFHTSFVLRVPCYLYQCQISCILCRG